MQSKTIFSRNKAIVICDPWGSEIVAQMWVSHVKIPKNTPGYWKYTSNFYCLELDVKIDITFMSGCPLHCHLVPAQWRLIGIST